jgi:hypothetical protein
LPPDADGDGERSLRGLLSEQPSSEDVRRDADALSLHSTFGSDGRKKKRSAGRARNVLRRQPRRVSVMGVALFGRPIHDGGGQNDNEEEEEQEDGEQVRRSTSDDAQPLAIDQRLIDRLTRGDINDQRFTTRPSFQRQPTSKTSKTEDTSYMDDDGTLDEEELRAREERRARRQERKAMKQAALSRAFDRDGAGTGEFNHEATFEGFQGSGSGHAAIPSPFRKSIAPPSESRSSGSSRSRSRGVHLEDHGNDEEHDADGDADFDAGSYARPRRTTGGSAGDRSSDTRSRTSGSRSVASTEPYRDELDSTPKPRRSKSGRSKSSRTKSSKTSDSSGPSAPLLSPASAHFSSADVQVAAAAPAAPEAEWAFPNENEPRFPSAGLGGGLRRKSSDAGAFLATRGGF